MNLVLLAGLWLLYFAAHTLLASLWAKRLVASRWPSLMPWYRILFNVLAVVLILPLLALTLITERDYLWAWEGAWKWIANGLAVLALGLLWYSTRLYDTAEFLGLRQLRDKERRVEDQERFRVSHFHRYVRHPWYFLGLVLLWTRDMTPELLVTTLLLTSYLVIGSQLEERKLLAYYGDAYARYRHRVPGLFPWPGLSLSVSEAKQLETLGREHQGGMSKKAARGPPRDF